MTKVSIVRGASRGISFAIAKRLYKDGFKIGIHDQDEETVKEAVGKLSPELTFVVTDVNKTKQKQLLEKLSNILRI